MTDALHRAMRERSALAELLWVVLRKLPANEVKVWEDEMRAVPADMEIEQDAGPSCMVYRAVTKEDGECN